MTYLLSEASRLLIVSMMVTVGVHVWFVPLELLGVCCLYNIPNVPSGHYWITSHGLYTADPRQYVSEALPTQLQGPQQQQPEPDSDVMGQNYPEPMSEDVYLETGSTPSYGPLAPLGPIPPIGPLTTSQPPAAPSMAPSDKVKKKPSFPVIGNGAQTASSQKKLDELWDQYCVAAQERPIAPRTYWCNWGRNKLYFLKGSPSSLEDAMTRCDMSFGPDTVSSPEIGTNPRPINMGTELEMLEVAQALKDRIIKMYPDLEQVAIFLNTTLHCDKSDVFLVGGSFQTDISTAICNVTVFQDGRKKEVRYREGMEAYPLCQLVRSPWPRPTTTTTTSTTSTTTTTTTSRPRTRPRWPTTAAPTHQPSSHYYWCESTNMSYSLEPLPLRRAGTHYTATCPEGHIGNVQFECSDTGEWLYLNDNCVAEWIINAENLLKDRLDSGKQLSPDEASVLADTFQNNTCPTCRLMFTAEIDKILTNIGSLQSAIGSILGSPDSSSGQSLFGPDSEQRRPAFVKKVVNSMIATCGNLIDSAHYQLWQRDVALSRSKNAQQIIRNVESAAFTVACEQVNAIESLGPGSTVHVETFALESEVLSKPLYFPVDPEGAEQQSRSWIEIPDSVKIDRNEKCRGRPLAVGAFYRGVGNNLLHSESVFKQIPIKVNLMSQTGSSGRTDESIMITQPVRDDYEINSNVIGFATRFQSKVYERVALPKPARIRLEHTKRVKPYGRQKVRCVFWNFTSESWDAEGCRLDPAHSSIGHSECLCDHLTNFAVLMDISGSEEQDQVKSVLTYICSAASLVCLLGTAAMLAFYQPLQSRRSTITINLCCCLAAVHLLVLVGLDRVDVPALCSTVSALLLFSLLGTFTWMLLEAHHIYQMLILVFASKGFRLSRIQLYCIGYGVPVFFTVMAVAVLQPQDQLRGELFCWISGYYGNPYRIWFFAAPALAVVLINCVVLVLALRAAYGVRKRRSTGQMPTSGREGGGSSQGGATGGASGDHLAGVAIGGSGTSSTPSKNQPTLKNIMAWIRGSASLVVLLGITWIFGLLYIFEWSKFFSYVFIVLNGLQGVFIFIFHIALNDKAKPFFEQTFIKKAPLRFLNSNKTLSSQLSSGPNKQGKGLNIIVAKEQPDCRKRRRPSNPNFSPEPIRVVTDPQFVSIDQPDVEVRPKVIDDTGYKTPEGELHNKYRRTRDRSSSMTGWAVFRGWLHRLHGSGVRTRRCNSYRVSNQNLENGKPVRGRVNPGLEVEVVPNGVEGHITSYPPASPPPHSPVWGSPSCSSVDHHYQTTDTIKHDTIRQIATVRPEIRKSAEVYKPIQEVDFHEIDGHQAVPRPRIESEPDSSHSQHSYTISGQGINVEVKVKLNGKEIDLSDMNILTVHSSPGEESDKGAAD